MRVARRAIAGGALAALSASACDQYAERRQRAQSASQQEMDSMGAAAHDIATVRLRATPELVENSAAAMSATQPGVLFTINDSDNEPLLFAIDTTGAERRVARARGQERGLGVRRRRAMRRSRSGRRRRAELRVHRRHR